MQRKGQAALVVPAPGALQYNRVLYRRDIVQPSVTIIIPTRDNIDLLERCVESISQKTTYSNYNILIIDNGSKENGTLESLQNLKNNKNVSVICVDIAFNYSTLNNLAAKNTFSDLLCFLNDDTEIISPDWLEEMTSFANQEDIGVVGARLWYPDGRLQHAGVVTGIHGISDHIYRYLERGNSGYYGRAVLHQSYSAVTGACMVVRRDVFEQVGGFDETLAVTLNDIDLCLKVRSIGYRNVWTPYAEVIHHESASRGSGNLPGSAYEITIFTSRWRDVLYNDPAYNVNLSLQNTHCDLAYPPRQMRYGNLSSGKLAMLEMNRFPVIEEARLLTDDFFVNGYSLLIEENKRLKKQIYDLTDDRYRQYNCLKRDEGNLIVCNELADTQEPNQDLLPATREKPVWLERYYIDIIVESGLFDSKWYLNQYGEKFGIIGDPLEHYLVHGMEISANPSPNFDTAYYLQANPDLAESPLHPFVHFVCQGHKENRPFLPPPPPEYESKYSAAEPEYISRLPADTPPVEKCVRVIAFYLPQFHAIPENDKWWGEGFTEWTNVKPAKPQFEGHYQPHVPDDFLGYYNLLDSKTQLKQIELAKQYGVEGFCFYIYWFSGRRLLEQPVDNYLSDSKLGLPFCVCWANENWSRRWDGLDSDLLMEQRYSPEDDIEFIANTAKYLRDPRYIRISGKPLLLVYRPNLFPNMRATTQRWRVWCREHGIGEIYLTYPQSFECVDPAEYGFDAACEFPPNNSSPPNITHKLAPKVEDFQTVVYDWRILLDRSDEYEIPKYTLFRSVTPSWDNTARKKNKGIVFQNSCPKLFEKWLTNAFVDTLVRQQEVDERIVFINAWNEWAEGAHLEPDKRYGYAWLNSILSVHRGINHVYACKLGIHFHVYYLDVFEDVIMRLSKIKIVKFKLYVTIRKEIYASILKFLKFFDIDYQIFVLENRGRDVLPFIRIMDSILKDNVDIILKIHTKKSKHRSDGDEWRNRIFDNLLCENQMINSIKNFYEDKGVGIISAEDQIVPMSYYWGSNEATVLKLSSQLNVSGSLLIDMCFVAGTMFFIRPEVASRLLELGLTDDSFEEENGQIDGTLAHAIERLFGVICYASGMRIVTNKGNNINYNFEFAEKTHH